MTNDRQIMMLQKAVCQTMAMTMAMTMPGNAERRKATSSNIKLFWLDEAGCDERPTKAMLFFKVELFMCVLKLQGLQSQLFFEKKNKQKAKKRPLKVWRCAKNPLHSLGWALPNVKC